MNLSLLNIITGGFGTGDEQSNSAIVAMGTVRTVNADDAALQLAYAGRSSSCAGTDSPRSRPSTNVVLVVGANDVTNPAARRPGNAVSGMPILDVDKARSVIVVKRSLGHGYAGIDNELYTNPRTAMLFGDAKAVLAALINELHAYVH